MSCCVRGVDCGLEETDMEDVAGPCAQGEILYTSSELMPALKPGTRMMELTHIFRRETNETDYFLDFLHGFI